MGEANALYVEKFTPIQLDVDRRKKFIDLLIVSFNNVDSIVSKCKQGIECFEKLLKNSQELFQTLKTTIESSNYSKNDFNGNNNNNKLAQNNRYLQYQNITSEYIKPNNQIPVNNVNSDAWLNTTSLNEMKIFNSNSNISGMMPTNPVPAGISFAKPTNNFKKQSIYDQTVDHNIPYQQNNNKFMDASNFSNPSLQNQNPNSFNNFNNSVNQNLQYESLKTVYSNPSLNQFNYPSNISSNSSNLSFQNAYNPR